MSLEVILMRDRRLTLPTFEIKAAASAAPAPAKAPKPKPTVATAFSKGVQRGQAQVGTVAPNQNATQGAAGAAGALVGRTKQRAANAVADPLGAAKSVASTAAAPIVAGVHHLQDKATAQQVADQRTGIHPLLSNISGARGAQFGALAGAALGALNPGKDDDGEQNSAIGGALRGAVHGGIAGGAIGYGARKFYVDPTRATAMPQALVDTKATRAAMGARPTAQQVAEHVAPKPVAEAPAAPEQPAAKTRRRAAPAAQAPAQPPVTAPATAPIVTPMAPAPTLPAPVPPAPLPEGGIQAAPGQAPEEPPAQKKKRGKKTAGFFSLGLPMPFKISAALPQSPAFPANSTVRPAAKTPPVSRA